MFGLARKLTLFAVWLLLLSVCTLNGYEVVFEGLGDAKILELIEKSSQLKQKKEQPSRTKSGLKRRIENDLVLIRNALQSFGFYAPTLSYKVSEDGSVITIQIEKGALFTFSSFTIRYFQNGEEKDENVLQTPIFLTCLNIEIGKTALPDAILSAEDTLLDKLNVQGFAFATVLKRDVFVDESAHQVIVLLAVETGPLSVFGTLDVKGLKNVKRGFIEKKLRWQEGEIYSPFKIEKTQEKLELSSLFRSVSITTGQEPVNETEVPITIQVIEGKQHSVGFGLNYNTELGFGVSGEWENRNLLGEGEKLSTRAEIWQKLQSVKVSYLIPDYLRQDQNLIWVLDYHTDHNKSYREQALSLSAAIEKKLSDKLDFTYGGMYKLLRSERSARNGTFDLLKIPMQVRWNDTDNLLDPSRGSTLLFRTTPTVAVNSPAFAYWINQLTATLYRPITKDKKHIFATKFMYGAIFGAAKREIPPPERFYAGSETTIRGYRFLTVSPLGEKNKPIGGRSLFVYSLELRNRLSKDIGLVFFYDIGNVYSNAFPRLDKGLLQSGGIGIRYYTPVGPIRLDLAFPFNRRHKEHGGWIDHTMEAYFSIGQAF